MADEPGEDTPLLDESPEPAPPPASEEAPAPEPTPPDETEAEPVEEPKSPITVDELSVPDEYAPGACAEETRSGAPLKPKGSAKEDLSASALQGFLQFFLTCCMPVVDPGSRATSPDIPRALPVHYHYITTFTLEAIADGFIIEKCASGKLGCYRCPDHEVNRAFAAVEDAIKGKVAELKGSAPESLQVVGYKDQKVVGINLFVKIKIDKGPDYIHAKIYQPIEGEPCLIDTTGLKLESDPIEYF